MLLVCIDYDFILKEFIIKKIKSLAFRLNILYNFYVKMKISKR